MNQLRSEVEVHAAIIEIKAAWIESPPVVKAQMRQGIMGELTSLYWILGYSRRQAMSAASVALGGEPIRWSDDESDS